MRTNIEIDDHLMRQAMRSSGASTKRGTVEAALRLLVETNSQTSIRRLKGKVRWEGNLEESRRGLYGGAICTIDNNGTLDSCIAIRTAFIKEGEVSVRAGCGVVFDSDPQKEADETRAKAKGVVSAVNLAMAGVL